MSESVKALNINCGLACLLKDREGILDKYEKIHINCGSLIASSAINAKLAAKGAGINSGDQRVKDIKGEIIQLGSGAEIDGKTNLKDLFVIATDNVLVRGDGLKRLAEAEGAIITGTLYYPESGDLSDLVNVDAQKCPYPDGAHVVLGSRTLEEILAGMPQDAKHIWISERLSVLKQPALEEAKSKGLAINCKSLFIYEGLNSSYGGLLKCPDRTLVPDGYEIAGSISSAELPLYGPRVYVNGDLSIEEKGIPALEELEALIVKGRAKIPSKAVKIFREKGKADSYLVFDGSIHEVNGFEQYSHGQFSGSSGEKISFMVNGCLLFDDDVTAEDVERIASLSYNGIVIASSSIKALLAPKVKEANGIMGDPAMVKEITGQSLQDLMGSGRGREDQDSLQINTGTYMLI